MESGTNGAVRRQQGGWRPYRSNQPLDVHAIEEENSMGWTYRDSIVSDQPMSNGPLLPSIRQIAYELELSITRHFSSDLA